MKLVKYKRQCFLLIISLGSLLSIYVFMINRLHILSKNKGDILKYYYALNGKLSNSSIPGPKVVKEGNALKVRMGNIESSECRVNTIDPFNKEILKYMHDFGVHQCPVTHNLQLDINFNRVKFSDGMVDYVQMREIIPSENIYRFKDYEYLIAPKHALKKDQFGALRNDASKRCVIPVLSTTTNHINSVVELMFSSNCDIPEAIFTFTKDGLIVHNATGKCLGPKGNNQHPIDNTQIVLSRFCQARFDVLGHGVLNMIGTASCIHNLWGGPWPAEGQKLCFFSDCTNLRRISYHWYHKVITDAPTIVKEVTLAKELNHLQFRFTDDTVTNAFVLSVQPKSLSHNARSKQPNIFILSIDEASAPHFKRKLPRTYKEMTKMGFLEFRTHAALFPSAIDNLMVITGGHTKKEEDCIFHMAKQSNYVSMYSSDVPDVNMVNVSDHNSLPLFQAIKRNLDLTAQSNCVGGQPIYDLSFNYLISFINAYPSNSKLGVMQFSQITRSNFNYIGYMDDSFVRTLSHLATLKNTIIFLQTLKGGLSGKLGQLAQGVEESKRLLLASYSSQDVREEYSFEVSRAKKLTTPFDVYATLRYLLSKSKNIGKTLFDTSLPSNCKESLVPSSLCPCL